MNIETQELTLSGAYNIVLKKARGNRLAYRRHQIQMRQQEKKLHGPVKEFMDYMTKKLKANLPNLKLSAITASEQKAKYADQKKIKKIVQQFTNWEEIRAEGQKILQPAELDVLEAGIESVTRPLRKQRVDPIGIEALRWSETHTAELVVEITAATMEAIEEIITVGIEAGKSIPAISRELRPIVGLNSQYAGAVDKYLTSLIEEGVADAAKKAERYAGRLHRRRTQTIARTESAFGLTEGQRQGYEQMGITRLERVEDPATEDDDCAEGNGKIYTIAESQGVLPAHPNCEGTWVAAA